MTSTSQPGSWSDVPASQVASDDTAPETASGIVTDAAPGTEAGDVTELRAALDRALRDKQEELGRLETGALALERTIERFSARMALLDEDLREARAEVEGLRAQVRVAELEQHRLERTVHERDVQLQALASQLESHPPGHRGGMH